jgi:tRNA1(Val) A37 N6-methylase TrmN6
VRKRPDGWLPPGPVPPGDCGDLALRAGEDETLDCLCGHWKIFQLRRGHRYSTDDFLTAWYAAQSFSREGKTPCNALDLGCGIGSVGLMLLWRFQELRLTGVEAQPVSAALAARSLRYNGAQDRAEVHVGDLRLFNLPGASFDLATGSPPYFVGEEGRRSDLPQRGPCRFEDRGGARDYLAAAARHLAPGGRMAWVHLTRCTEENLAAARDAGFYSVSLRPVVFREGKPSLITLFLARREGEGTEPRLVEPPLVVRDAAGCHTREYRSIRQIMGFPTQEMPI